MAPVTETPLDFTLPRRIGSTRLDTAFGSLVRGGEGVPSPNCATLRAPGLSICGSMTPTAT
jgi:hypothetical protein